MTNIILTFYTIFLLFLGTKTRQRKFIHGLRKTPKLDVNKPKKLFNLGIIQSSVATKKESLTATSTSCSNSIPSLVSADYESSSSSD